MELFTPPIIYYYFKMNNLDLKELWFVPVTKIISWINNKRYVSTIDYILMKVNWWYMDRDSASKIIWKLRDWENIWKDEIDQSLKR